MNDRIFLLKNADRSQGYSLSVSGRKYPIPKLYLRPPVLRLMERIRLLLFWMIALAFSNGMAQSMKVESSAADIKPIEVGEGIPAVMVLDLDNQAIDLNTHLKDKKTVLIVYRGGWCPYCNRHLKDLMDIEEELKSLGFNILGMSADNPAHAFKTLQKNELTYDLISDPKMEACAAMGLAFKLDEKTIRKYQAWNLGIEDAAGYDHHILPVPAVFIVDENATIRFRHYDPDYKQRLSAEEVLAAAKGL